ncbi:MAG TPA: hypothetical protein VFU06_00875 [Longimicrobiales bacterium]|nr:hypothetical protein [Longimicrobiales bacterium]
MTVTREVGLVEHPDEPARLSEILRTWAAAIREDTPTGVDAERAERNGAMADVLERASHLLLARYAGDGLLAAIRRASAIRADGVPPGFDLAQVYTDGDEVVVSGEPLPDEPHDCDAMGCGPSAHVIFRTSGGAETEPPE